MKQFNRTARAVIGTLEVSSLAMAFEVSHTATPAPNNCKLEIRNLNATSRKSLEATKALPIELYAGYGDEAQRIFKGQVRIAQTALNGRDVITTLEAGDEERAVRHARISATIAPGDSASALMEKAAEALGVGLGNLASVLAKVAALRSLLPQGGAIHGSAARAMDRVCKAYGYQWSIQQGQLLILDSRAVKESAELISAGTGLIGAPKVDSKKHVSFDCLLRPSLAIGESFKLESAFVNGGFRVLEFTHKGDTHGEAWTTSVVCDKV